MAKSSFSLPFSPFLLPSLAVYLRLVLNLYSSSPSLPSGRWLWACSPLSSSGVCLDVSGLASWGDLDLSSRLERLHWSSGQVKASEIWLSVENRRCNYLTINIFHLVTD